MFWMQIKQEYKSNELQLLHALPSYVLNRSEAIFRDLFNLIWPGPRSAIGRVPDS